MNKHKCFSFSNLIATFIVCTKRSKYSICSRFITHLHILCTRYNSNKWTSDLVLLLVHLLLSRSMFLCVYNSSFFIKIIVAADCLVGRNERMWHITESDNALILSLFGLERRLEDISDGENERVYNEAALWWRGREWKMWGNR